MRNRQGRLWAAYSAPQRRMRSSVPRPPARPERVHRVGPARAAVGEAQQPAVEQHLPRRRQCVQPSFFGAAGQIRVVGSQRRRLLARHSSGAATDCRHPCSAWSELRVASSRCRAAACRPVHEAPRAGAAGNVGSQKGSGPLRAASRTGCHACAAGRLPSGRRHPAWHAAAEWEDVRRGEQRTA